MAVYTVLFTPSQIREPHFLRSFEIIADDPATVYTQLDELLASGEKIPPTSDDIVARFGTVSFNFFRSANQLEEAYDAVAGDSTVAVKFREWNSLLAKFTVAPSVIRNCSYGTRISQFFLVPS